MLDFHWQFANYLSFEMSDYSSLTEEPLTELELRFILELLDCLCHDEQNNIHAYPTLDLSKAHTVMLAGQGKQVR